MKNYLLITILLFSIISCNEDDIDITDSFRSENGLTFNESLETWNRLKSINGDSYTYETTITSWVGRKATTEIIVENNSVIGRKYTSYIIDETNQDEISYIIESSYEEDLSNLNTNQSGAELKTIDEIYNDCSSKYLSVNSKTNKLYLSTNNEGIINACGYTPEDCADDCDFGIYISKFEWNKQ